MNDADFLIADWPAPAGIVAGTSLRTGGLSGGTFASLNLGDHVGDDPSAVAANRERLADYLKLPSEPVWLRQVHGTRVVEASPDAHAAEADASWTARAGIVCVVMTADCLPVLFASRDGRVVAASHAGWRGLAEGVIEATVSALPVPPGELLAWLGPAISQSAFEVGDEVRREFLRADARADACFLGNERGRWQADLYGLARQRLRAAGVAATYGGAGCTHAEEDRFFSHRRDGRSGRMATVIFRNKQR
jgi:YfiH family protein